MCGTLLAFSPASYRGVVSEPRDLPVCIIGDSFVAGYGDETGRGWTAHLVEEGAGVGLSLHTTVAGIGGDTSEMILDRWDEVDRRRAAFPTTAVIAEFGVNDVMEHEGALRVEEAGTVSADWTSARTGVDARSSGGTPKACLRCRGRPHRSPRIAW